MLAKRIKEFRNKKNLSQDDLGKILNTSGKNVSAWERNVTRPDIETLKKIATYFNTTTDYLLGIEDYGKDKFQILKQTLEENGLEVNDNLTIEHLSKALKIVEVMEKEEK